MSFETAALKPSIENVWLEMRALVKTNKQTNKPFRAVNDTSYQFCEVGPTLYKATKSRPIFKVSYLNNNN